MTSPYIDPPEPADDVVIWPATEDRPSFTWGDHRQLRAMLDEAEEENPATKAAGERLQQALVDVGWVKNGRVVQICKHCWRREDEPHEVECPEHNDPAMWVKREAAAYRYLGPDFVPVHVTSVPMTDDEAIEYFGVVELMFVGPGPHAVYIMRKDLGSNDFHMLPWKFNNETWEVEEIVRPS